MAKKPTYKELEQQVKEFSDLKQVQEKLQSQKNMFESIIGAMVSGMTIRDLDYNITYQNDVVTDLFGNRIGEKCYRVFEGNDKICDDCPVELSFKDGGTHVSVRKVEMPTGEIAFWQNIANPIKDANGKITSCVEINTNITERMQMKERLEKRAHELEQRIKELNCLYDISKIYEKPSFSFEGTIQEIVDLIPTSFQYPKMTCAQVIIDSLEFRTDNFREMKWKLTRDIIVHGERVGALEVFYLNESTECDEDPFLDEEKSLTNAISEQLARITESDRMETALRESEQKFRRMFENNSAIMFLVEPRTLEIVDANYAAEKFYGFERNVLVQKNLHDLSAMTDEELRKEIQRSRKRERDFSVFKHTLANGQIRDVEVRTTPIRMDGDKVLNSVIIHDITDRIRAENEKKKLESQLRRAHKMEAIGTLAGGIAHDFNNILWIINGNIELALTQITKGSPATYNLKEVEKACQRASDLVTQILSFTRQTDKKRQPLKFSSMVKESLKLMRSSLPSTIEIQETIIDQSDTILADITQINQVLLNLYTNAAHAMKEKGGELEVNLINFEIDDNDAASVHGLPAGNYVKLSVRDTGHGINPENIDRIFDPYFTTKNIGEGTGMGLSMAYGIIRNHGGTITVESTPEKGTLFQIFLPIFEKREDELEAETFETLPAGTERILFVDDEKAVLDLVKQVLTRLGYESELYLNPKDALKSFKAKPEKYDLVITDQTMPHMTGKELAKELMSIRPDIPIILCTGFSEQIDEKKAEEMGIRAYVMKPVVMRGLAKTIRKVLDEN